MPTPAPTPTSPSTTRSEPAQLKRIRTRSIWEGAMRTRHQVRNFAAFRTAEPVPIGGDDSSPSPMEYVVAALGGVPLAGFEEVNPSTGRLDSRRLTIAP